MKEKEEQLSGTCNFISLNPDQSGSAILSPRGKRTSQRKICSKNSVV